MTDEESSQSSRELRLEHEWKVYENVQRLIERADSKAAFLFAGHTFFLGFLGSNLDSFKRIFHTYGSCDLRFWFCLSALVAYAIPVVVSLWALAHVVSPKMGKDCPHTLMFAGHIAARFERCYSEFSAAISGQTEEQREADIQNQILDNSCIAFVKMKLIVRATRWSLASGLLWIVALCVLQIIAPQIK